jgi:hypothetical protein
VTILAFQDAQKTPNDIIVVECDWSPMLPANAVVVSHSVQTEPGDLTEYAFNESIPPGLAMVTSEDAGMTGLLQKVKLSGGNLGCYSIISCRVVLEDGTDKTRSFMAQVR